MVSANVRTKIKTDICECRTKKNELNEKEKEKEKEKTMYQEKRKNIDIIEKVIIKKKKKEYECQISNNVQKKKYKLVIIETIQNILTNINNEKFVNIRNIIFTAINLIDYFQINSNKLHILTFCEEALPVKGEEKKENNKCANVDIKKNNEHAFGICIDKKNALNSIISSTFAGIISRTVTAPLDRIKYIMQITDKLSISEIYEIIKKDGIITGFFRGNCVNIVKIIPELSIKMYSYEFMKINVYNYYYQKNNNFKREENINIPFYLRFLIGSSSGILAALCIYPLEIVKTRLIVSNKTQDKGIIQCFYNIYKKEKLRNFYNGLSMHMYGVIFFSGCNMSIYDYMKYLFFSFYKNYVHLNYCMKNNITVKSEHFTPLENDKVFNQSNNNSSVSNIGSITKLHNKENSGLKILSNVLGAKEESFKEEKQAFDGREVIPIKGNCLYGMNGLLNIYSAEDLKRMNESDIKKKEWCNNSLYKTTKNAYSYNFPKQNIYNFTKDNITNWNQTGDNCSYCDYRIKNVNCFLFLFFGISSSFIAQIVSYPFLVLRTRMQTLNNEIATNYLNNERKRIKSCAFILYNIKMYGFRSLYRGIYVNLLKTIPATSITWLSYEYSMRKLKNM